MTTAEHPVSRHYNRADLGETILDGLRAAGVDLNHVTPAELTPIDQFHLGSRDATIDLMRLAELQLRPGSEILDAGGGLGGPARTLATELDARVTVLDLSEEFCRTGAMLTERTGLSDRVTFRHGNALDVPFPDASFDAVWTQHSSMNIDEKERLYAEFHRVLRPSGRLAIHEITAGPNKPVHFPVPWAGSPAISFLRPASDLRSLIAHTGFRELAWVDLTVAALAWWRERVEAAAAQPTPPPLGLHLLFGPQTKTILPNLLTNLEESRIEVVQGVFARE